MFLTYIGYLSFGIGLIDVIVILCGTIQALVEFVRLEVKTSMETTFAVKESLSGTTSVLISFLVWSFSLPLTLLTQ